MAVHESHNASNVANSHPAASSGVCVGAGGEGRKGGWGRRRRRTTGVLAIDTHARNIGNPLITCLDVIPVLSERLVGISHLPLHVVNALRCHNNKSATCHLEVNTDYVVIHHLHASMVQMRTQSLSD